MPSPFRLNRITRSVRKASTIGMESTESSAHSSDKPPQGLADLVGTAIALLTLTIPLYAIARYSSNSVEVMQQVTYPLPEARE